MAKITLTDITSGFLSPAAYNTNNTTIEDEFDNCLSRDGSTPNSMSADIDMDSNKVTNLANGTNNQDAVTVAQLNAASVGGGGGATNLNALTDVDIASAAKGELMVYNGSSWVDVSVGSNDQVLTADSAQAAGLKWATSGGGGGISNVVEDTTPQLGGALDMNSNNITAAGAVAISPTEMSYLNNVSSNIQTQLDAKGTLSNLVEDTTPELGGALNMNSNNITAAGPTTITPTEMSYLDGVTSNIQTQMDTKLANVVEDTTPQLGGALDAQSNNITTVAALTMDGTLTVEDSTNADSLQLTHDGTNIKYVGAGSTNAHRFSGVNSVDIYGPVLRVWHSNELDYCTMSHDNTDFNFDFTNTADVVFKNNAGYVEIGEGAGGGGLRVKDNGGTDYMYFEHTGTDGIIGGINTTDINIEFVDFNFGDNNIKQVTIEDYAIEAPAENTISANAVTVTYSNGNAQEIDLEAATGNVTVTVSGGPPSGTYGEMIIKVKQDTTADRTLTWAGGTFVWPGGTEVEPKTGSDAITLYYLSTWDTGTTWYINGVEYG